MTRTRAAAVVLVGAVLLTGCGNDETTLDGADRALGKLDRGEISVALTAGAGQPEGATAGPVGFTMAGRFDVAAGTELPVLDVTYTRMFGEEEEQVVTVQSDGTKMVVTTDGTAVDVPPEQASSLQLGGGDRPAGLGELGIGGWITEPTESEGPTVDGVATRKVTGPVDAADLMSDLSMLAGQVSGQGEGQRLTGEAAARVRSRVRSGDVEILVDEDDLPRRVRATVNFGSTVAPEVQQALGPYAAARLEVVLEVRAPGQPVPPPSFP